MIVTSFQTRAPLSAVNAAVVAALTVAVAPTAHADDQWGACAAGGKNNVCEVGYPDEAAAISRANSLCNYLVPNRPPCPAHVSFTDCGALARSGDQWAGGTGPTREAAEQEALNQLPGSRIIISRCNG
jgi:Domain of unknown function (DUF4189)